MIELTIGAGDGVKSMSRVLGFMQEVIGSMEPVWRSVVHPYMVRHGKFQLQSEGRHGGSPWVDYSAEPSYRAYKKSQAGHLEILRWYQDLSKGRFPPSIINESSEHIFRATDERVTIGSSVPWANDLTEGGVGPFGERFPGRMVYAMTSFQKKDLTSLIQQAIVNMAGADTLRAARRAFQRQLHGLL